MFQGKTCLVTGATSGIGRAAALSLASQGASLLVVCRNKEKGDSLLKEINEMSRRTDHRLYTADLSSQEQIRRLAQEIRANHVRIDILLNNAGGIFAQRTHTVDHIELTFALNHLAYFLLTKLLLGVLCASPSARIVNISSQAHLYGSLDFDDLGPEKRYNAMKAYAQSKLANLLFTYELSRRLNGTNVSVNAVHPGAVRTNFGKELSGIGGFVFRRLDMFMRSPEKGAETPLWLAGSSDAEGVTGRYYMDMREIRSSKSSYDLNSAKRLWDVSARMTGL